MKDGFRTSPVARVIAIALVALTIGYVMGAAITVRQQDQSRLERTPLVNKALDLYGHGKVTREDLLKRYDPTVVYLPNMTCVAMKPRRPFVGGEDTMCFDKNERRFLFYFTNGD
jgi:hypothetical protein